MPNNRKYDHENHNRQDKVLKPDYRGAMVQRGRSEDVVTPSSRLIARASARENLIGTIKKSRFVYRDLSFKFGWNLQVFAAKNNLPVNASATKEAMDLIRQAAERDVEAFAERIKKATIRKNGSWYQFDYERPQTECRFA